jgi:hypothetical protein
MKEEEKKLIEEFVFKPAEITRELRKELEEILKREKIKEKLKEFF